MKSQLHKIYNVVTTKGNFFTGELVLIMVSTQQELIVRTTFRHRLTNDRVLDTEGTDAGALWRNSKSRQSPLRFDVVTKEAHLGERGPSVQFGVLQRKNVNCSLVT